MKCPLKLTIYSTLHPDLVRIDNTTAVIYRGRNRYYIIIGYYRWTVTMADAGTHFELKLRESALRFLYEGLNKRGYITQ
jgi:hypothetical protein